MRPHIFNGSNAYTEAAQRPVVTVGNFDGVHLGHAALLARVVELARRHGAPAVVVTFDPSPVEVLRPEQPSRRLQRLSEKIAAIRAMDVDHVVIEAFDTEYAQHDARWFAMEVIGHRLGARALVLGHDFRFGRGRGGGFAELSSWLPIPVEQVAAVIADGTAVSSSRIRAALDQGDVAAAAALLGRPHRLVGTVVRGERRGHTLGFPTANVAFDARLLPPAPGVYAVRTPLGGGAANLGVRPTFQGSELRLEVHLLDFAGDLYGTELAVDFIARLRSEQTFAGPAALVTQLHADIEAARAALA